MLQWLSQTSLECRNHLGGLKITINIHNVCALLLIEIIITHLIELICIALAVSPLHPRPHQKSLATLGGFFLCTATTCCFICEHAHGRLKLLSLQLARPATAATTSATTVAHRAFTAAATASASATKPSASLTAAATSAAAATKPSASLTASATATPTSAFTNSAAAAATAAAAQVASPAAISEVSCPEQPTIAVNTGSPPCSTPTTHCHEPQAPAS
jgi:hypothetical protein